MTSIGSSYRWFPWAIAGSMGFVVAVNLALAYFAFSSSPGLVTQHPFDEGNGYNAILEAAARQDALGWTAKLAFSSSATTRGELDAAFTDRAGKPVHGLSVTAHIERPVEARPEILLALPEAEAGRYRAHADLGEPGQWDVRIVARRGDELYEFGQRILVK